MTNIADTLAQLETEQQAIRALPADNLDNPDGDDAALWNAQDRLADLDIALASRPAITKRDRRATLAALERVEGCASMCQEVVQAMIARMREEGV